MVKVKLIKKGQEAELLLDGSINSSSVAELEKGHV